MVLIVPPNKDYIVMLHQSGQRFKVPRATHNYFKVNDICKLVVENNKQRLKVLTDDDEFVIMNHPDRKRMVPYGYFDIAA